MGQINELRTEYHECIALAEYLEQMRRLGKIRLFTHIPNETFTTSWNQKIKNKRMGVNRGFPDYIVLTDTQMVVIEMKRMAGGTVSKEQKEWIKEFTRLGIPAKVCKGYDEAVKFLNL